MREKKISVYMTASADHIMPKEIMSLDTIAFLDEHIYI